MIEFLSKTNWGRWSVALLPLFLGALLLAGCEAGGGTSEYANPGRPETYDAQNTGYEKPWPFGDVGNGH